jgi:hypothetical protein
MRPVNATARARVLDEIRRATPARAADVAARLQIGVATFHRIIAERREDIFAVGAAARRRYAVRRALRGQPASLPAYRIDTHGQGEVAGTIELVAPQGSYFDPRAVGWPVVKDTTGWWDGLPYPLYDMRPQGFLGRNFARAVHADFAVPTNPADWNDDDIAYALSQRGADTIGNLIVGNRAYQRFLDQMARPPVPIAAAELLDRYAALARDVANLGVPGASAGGEFPKFTACRELPGSATPHVVVKFSGADESKTVQRWADLLVCEHIALETLRNELKLESVRSRILQGYGRTFLETERFDRHGMFGRSAVVSLEAIESSLVGGTESDWSSMAMRLHALGLIDTGTQADIDTVWWFGRLIANTDMHPGNLSFRFAAEPGVAPQLRLAPAYDMLPMAYAPLAGGEVPPREYSPPLPLPTQRPTWTRAFHGALAFWRCTAEDERISAPFRQICLANGNRLATMGDRIGV